MNMFAMFDENPAMTLRVIKETKRYGWTDARTDNMKTVYPLQTKFAGGINSNIQGRSPNVVNVIFHAIRNCSKKKEFSTELILRYRPKCTVMYILVGLGIFKLSLA